MTRVLEKYEQYLDLAPVAIEAQPNPIIHSGLTWSDAERIQAELVTQAGHTRPMYGIGMNAAGYYIAKRDYYGTKK